MRLLSSHELIAISDAWDAAAARSIQESSAFYDRLQVPCQIVLPLGELINPKIAGAIWVWNLKGIIKPEPITRMHRFNANGLEGCFTIEEMLSTAILLFGEVSPDRINVFATLKQGTIL